MMMHGPATAFHAGGRVGRAVPRRHRDREDQPLPNELHQSSSIRVDRFIVRPRTALQLSVPPLRRHPVPDRLALAGTAATFTAIAFSGGPPMRRLMLLCFVALVAHAAVASAQKPAARAAPAAPAPAAGLKASDVAGTWDGKTIDRKSTRLNSSHGYISYAAFCLKKK